MSKIRSAASCGCCVTDTVIQCNNGLVAQKIKT